MQALVECKRFAVLLCLLNCKPQNLIISHTLRPRRFVFSCEIRNLLWMCLDFSKHSQKSMFKAKLEEKVGEITVKCIHCISSIALRRFQCARNMSFSKKVKYLFSCSICWFWERQLKTCTSRVVGCKERGRGRRRRKPQERFYHFFLLPFAVVDTFCSQTS